MLKPILALSTALVITLSAIAQDMEINPDHPDRYIVVPGDTLWDISERFLNTPWMWPEIWQINPQIENPHLIYPGDEISLIYVDGQPQLRVNRGRRTVKLSPKVRRTPLGDSVKPLPLSAIKPFLEDRVIVDESVIPQLPYVVAMDEERVNGIAGQPAYVRNLEPGSRGRYAIMRPTEIFKEAPKKGKQIREPWDIADGKSLGEYTESLWRTMTGYDRRVEVLGRELIKVAEAEVRQGGDPATMEITDSIAEVRAGDVLMPVNDNPFDLEFYPQPPTEIPENTRVIALSKTYYAAGPNQVVVINRGNQDGVKNGQVYAAYRPGQKIRDTAKYPRDDAKTYFSPQRRRDAQVQLPDERGGELMIFRTFDRVSYALVMRTVRPVRVMDKLMAP